jgi:predicted nucleotidyltransferase
VLLFGSRATGTHLRASDIDLVVVADAFEGIPWIERLHLVLSLWDGEVDLEPLCYTPAEFKRRSNQATIVREAARTGIRLTLP